MITKYYKIADSFKINDYGVNAKAANVKFLTEQQYLKALEELMRKGFDYNSVRKCWERINEDDSTDIVHFSDYK